VGHSFPVGSVDGCRVIVDVAVVRSRQVQRIVVEVPLEQPKSLGGFGVDQLLDSLELEMAVVVLRRNALLERVTVGSLLDVRTDGLDEEICPVSIQEVGDRVDSVDEILRRLKVDSPRIVARTHPMCRFCT
jgi:hypothetical protein